MYVHSSENCNYVCELGKQMGLSLDGVKGEDIHNGNQTQVLGELYSIVIVHSLTLKRGVVVRLLNIKEFLLSHKMKIYERNTLENWWI